MTLTKADTVKVVLEGIGFTKKVSDDIYLRKGTTACWRMDSAKLTNLKETG